MDNWQDASRRAGAVDASPPVLDVARAGPAGDRRVELHPDHHHVSPTVIGRTPAAVDDAADGTGHARGQRAPGPARPTVDSSCADRERWDG